MEAQAYKIAGRQSPQNSADKRRTLSRKKKEIFGDTVEFPSSQPKVVINGRTVDRKDIKALKPSLEMDEVFLKASRKTDVSNKASKISVKKDASDLDEAFMKAAKRLDLAEEKELEKLCVYEDCEAVIRDFKRFKAIHPRVEIPKYDAKKEGELDRLKVLFKLAIKQNTSGSVIVYKQWLLISMVVIEIVSTKWLGVDARGLFDMHLANMRLYDASFMEMCVKNGGKGFYENLSPGYQLMLAVFGSTILFMLMRWGGAGKETAINSTTSITGYMGTTEDVPKGEGGVTDALLGFIPMGMKMMGMNDDAPLQQEVQHVQVVGNKVPVVGRAQSSPVKKRVSLPVRVVKN